MKKLFWFLLLLIGAACTSGPADPGSKTTPATSPLDTLSWLLAGWEMQTDDGFFRETWKQSSDTLFSGFGLMVAGKDTVFAEQIELIASGGSIDYIVRAQGQNEGMKVPFRLTASGKGFWKFENPGHDFPQMILYTRPHPDSLVAIVNGKFKGIIREEVFRMKKLTGR